MHAKLQPLLLVAKKGCYLCFSRQLNCSIWTVAFSGPVPSVMLCQYTTKFIVDTYWKDSKTGIFSVIPFVQCFQRFPLKNHNGLNTIHIWICDIIFPAIYNPIFAPRTVLSLINTVVRLSRFVFNLTILGTARACLVLNLSHLLAYTLGFTISNPRGRSSNSSHTTVLVQCRIFVEAMVDA